MCGIAGIFEFDRDARVDPHVLRRMTDLIAHRGPDDSGHWISGNIGLGHRRLSIIDLSPSGHQPMGNDDGSIWITYNGECYNYAELAEGLRQRGHAFRSTSDTEVLLRLYEERGERFLDDVDGMFALAIWDARKQSLLLARDRLGIKPLYYFGDRQHFIFASEMKSLLADPQLPIEIDPAALSEYFQLLSVSDTTCILRGVQKLLPGECLKVTARGMERRAYWQLEIDPDPGLSFEAVCGEFERRFAKSVRSHMVADVSVGAFLSGGVDSSAIVSAGSKAASAPMETFSITFPGLEEFDEGPYAATVAQHCGANHHEFKLSPDLIDGLGKIVWHADEPFAVSSAFALYYLAELARRHVKVVLSGDGGDEVFAGYVWRHIDFPPIEAAATALIERVAPRLRGLARLAGLVPASLRRAAAGPSDERYLRSFACFHPEELAGLLDPDAGAAILAAAPDNAVQRCFNAAPAKDQLNRKLYTDIKTTLVSEMLTKADRMTMAHGLEARVPFLDHHLVSWAFTVPPAYKLNGSEGKYLVKKAMEPHLPASILYRRKQGFNVPLKVWMRGPLRDFVRDSLESPRLTGRGLYRATGVSALLDDHFSCRVDASNKIFTLLMLELWQQRFIDAREEFRAPAAPAADPVAV